jgi:UDP-N-acetylmuramoyl-tripeptide--D-alanyl-D-alanine ligase
MQTKLTGKYNLSNIGYAIAVGKYFNLTDDLIKEALETYTPKDMRSQIIEKNNNLIVLDAYNANPTSLKAAIDSLVNMQGNNKVAIVGDMFELGKKSAEEHQFIADYLKEKNIDAYLIGKNFGQTQSKYDKYDDTESFIKSKNFDKLKNATILIKGSRGMAMEKIIE